MPSPFPGMDPYLERKGLWSEVHHDLITDIRRALAKQLPSTYRVAIDRANYSVMLGDVERIGDPDVIIYEQESPSAFHSGTAVLDVALAVPDVIVLPTPFDYKQGYLEIRELGTEEVITVIEVLSHANKAGRRGRQQYLDKREKIMRSRTNLVEIDLLRSGHAPPLGAGRRDDYAIVVSRSWHRPRAAFYTFSVRESIPIFSIPLKRGQLELVLDLNDLLQQIYDSGGYDMAIDYRRPPTPCLSEEDAEWAQQLLAKEL